MSDLAVPVLLRAALEVTLENKGVERPRASKSGQITEWPYLAAKRFATDDPLLVCESIFLASHLVQIISGERPRVAQELLNLVAGDRAEVLEEKFRDIFASHEFSPADLRDCVHRAGRMIGASGPNIQPQF